jgi:alkanesulfonate monooxygenase SsuD/methylene tetrahydromethanopterin reductase-like flavin-dependent oxidoreductase (luciferase family)
MIRATVVSGDEATVRQGLERLLAMGAGELLVSVVHAGADRDASVDRTLRLLGQVSRSLD